MNDNQNAENAGQPEKKSGAAPEAPNFRFIRRGDVQHVLLYLLAEKPMHGYEMIKALEERSAGFYRPSPGSVYPTLQMLEDLGWIESQKESRKKIFQITDEGREVLARAPQDSASRADLFARGEAAGEPCRHPHPTHPHMEGRGPHGDGRHHHHRHGRMSPEDFAIRGLVKDVSHRLFHASRCSAETPERRDRLEAMLKQWRDELDAFIEADEGGPKNED